MSTRDLSKWLLGLASVGAAACLAACLNNAKLVPLSPAGQGVRVDSGEPPTGAHLVGPVTATHGSGCGIANERGTEAGATAALREAAARRGITFVKLTKTTKPYAGHDCFHQEYTLEGLGYRIDGIEKAAPLAPILAPSVASASAPGVAPSAAVPAAPASAAPAECAPPCSPGYACHASVCEAECNPLCAADQTCRADRVCVPRAPTP
ncbi:MAG: hypothetical protein ABI488_21065 [Polyangiaceae bacterium]